MNALTQVQAKVIAGSAAKALGEGWEYKVLKKEVKAEGAKFTLYDPSVWHKSGLIGLSFVPNTGWIAAIGLRSGLTEGDKLTESAFMTKIYSDANTNPRRAVIECINRLRRVVHSLAPQFDQLDQIIRAAARAEDPATAPPDPLTFEQWYLKKGPSLVGEKEAAEAAWKASKEGA